MTVEIYRDEHESIASLVEGDIFAPEKSYTTKAEEAKSNTTVLHVVKNIEGQEISGDVVFWEYDARSAAEKLKEKEDGNRSPIAIYWTGFGLQKADGPLSSIEEYMIENGIRGGIKRYIFASIKNLPSTTSKELKPNATDSAEIMLDVLTPERLEFDDVRGFPPIKLYSYSASGSASISEMARLLEYEEKHVADATSIPNGKHTLNLTSLTGVAEYAVDPNSARESAAAFINEVTHITLETIKAQFAKLGSKFPSKGEHSEVGSDVSALEHIAQALEDAGDSISALGRVLKRAISTDKPHLTGLRRELLSLRTRSPDVMHITSACNVEMRIPAHDSVQDASIGTDRLIAEGSYKLGYRVPWRDETIVAYEKLAFPFANRVVVHFIETEDSLPDGTRMPTRHTSVWKKPDKHLNMGTISPDPSIN